VPSSNPRGHPNYHFAPPATAGYDGRSNPDNPDY